MLCGLKPAFPVTPKRFNPNHFVTLSEIGNDFVDTVVLSDDETVKISGSEKHVKKSSKLTLRKKERCTVDDNVKLEFVSHYIPDGEADVHPVTLT